MICKQITLNVLSNTFPYRLMILSNNNKILNNILINSKNAKICIATTGCSIILMAKNGNQTLYQKINLKKCKKQRIFIPLAFSNFQQSQLNLISLTDFNYNFPVSQAILNFKQL